MEEDVAVVGGASLGKIGQTTWKLISSHDPRRKEFGDFLAGRVSETVPLKRLTPESYLLAREGIFPKLEIPIKKSGNPKEKAKDKIIRENAERLCNEAVQKFKKNGSSSGYLELIILGRISQDPATVLDFLAIDPTDFPELLKEDILSTQKKLRNDFENGLWETILKKHPETLISKKLELRNHQIEVIKALDENPQCLILYRAGLGSGKTTSAGKLAHTLQGTKKKVVFCCANDIVRVSVGQLAFSLGISFGFVVIHPERGLSYSWSSFSIPGKEFEMSNLIITDYYTAQEFLRKHGDLELILFIDEPNIGAEKADSLMLRSLMKLFKTYAPKQTILVSATLPELEVLSEVYNFHTKKYPNSKIINIDNKEVRVFCDVISSGKFWIPREIGDVSSLRRLYNRRLLLQFLGSEQKRIRDGLMKDWSPEGVARTNEEILVLQDSPQIVAPEINDCFFTKNAHKLFGNCLIVCENPLDFVLKEIEGLIEGRSWNSLSKSLIVMESKERIVEGTKLERAKAAAEIPPPDWTFPEELQINSIAHLRKWAPGVVLNRSHSIFPVGPSDLPETSDDRLKIMLAMGIGLYGENAGDAIYRETVASLMLQGRLSFVIADSSIAYGVNASFAHMILPDPDFIANHSIGTLLQMLARVGRGSYESQIFALDDSLIERLENAISGKEKDSEALNMLEAFRKTN